MIGDLLVELRVCAADYFERASFYAATGRADHEDQFWQALDGRQPVDH